MAEIEQLFSVFRPVEYTSQYNWLHSEPKFTESNFVSLWPIPLLDLVHPPLGYASAVLTGDKIMKIHLALDYFIVTKVENNAGVSMWDITATLRNILDGPAVTGSDQWKWKTAARRIICRLNNVRPGTPLVYYQHQWGTSQFLGIMCWTDISKIESLERKKISIITIASEWFQQFVWLLNWWEQKPNSI